MNNWRTTVLGLLTILYEITPVGMAVLNGQAIDWAQVNVPAIFSGVGLIFAGDAKRFQDLAGRIGPFLKR